MEALYGNITWIVPNIEIPAHWIHAEYICKLKTADICNHKIWKYRETRNTKFCDCKYLCTKLNLPLPSFAHHFDDRVCVLLKIATRKCGKYSLPHIFLFHKKAKCIVIHKSHKQKTLIFYSIAIFFPQNWNQSCLCPIYW